MKRRLFVLGTLAFIFVIAGQVNAQGFRCGSNLVQLGATKAEVMMKCKQPMMIEKAGSTVVGAQSGQITSRGRGQYSTESVYAESQAAVEDWYYNCGEGQFMYVLTFSGGILAGIHNTEQRCTGLADWEK